MTTMLRFQIAIVMIVQFCGCATHRISSNGNGWHAFNAAAQNKTTTIVVLTDSSKIVARNVQISDAYVLWVDATGDTHVKSMSEVKEIDFISRWKGSKYGAGIGACSGVAMLALLAAAEKDGLVSSEGIVILLAPVAGGFGGLIGLIIGTATGFTDRWIINQ